LLGVGDVEEDGDADVAVRIDALGGVTRVERLRRWVIIAQIEEGFLCACPPAGSEREEKTGALRSE
jgi:hypothetical protein